jgi:ribA/ribD-fused uncharacterized protein
MTGQITSFTGEYEFLSNFSWSPVLHDSIQYPTVEHAFQAAKTYDKDERRRIAALPTPGMAKRAGRKVKLRKNWNEMRVKVMRTLLRKKFLHPGLAGKLLATEDAELIEGNSWGDTFWGVCNGVGENRLGKLLMEIREELNNEISRQTPSRFDQ